ncbi:LysR family transcriptional regulator [Pseudooceanicola aestuarii]|uniref:LysR family transcriptional regulator n=1 Tax=Pseudooceanicola aestuarii TaxID=2697319 RepID=UPI0023BAB107|nr:LysR family transcriptional regulator [Pseudooceanicola aestuarii]
MDVRQIRYFVTLAERRHFGQAAEMLHIAQPALSQQIKQLEAQLQVELLDRSTRPIGLTPAGMALLHEGREILAKVTRAEKLTRQEGSKDGGRLIIGVTGTAALEFAVPVLQAFGRRRPNVQVSLRELASPDQLSALERGDIHIGFVRPPVEDERMSIRLVHTDPFYVALSADHPLARRESVRLAELSGTSLVIFSREEAPGFRDLMLHVCRSAGYVPTTIQDASQMSTMLCLVGGGFGCALVPRSAQRMQIPDVVYRPIMDYSPPVELYAVWMPDNYAPFIGELLDVVEKIHIREG